MRWGTALLLLLALSVSLPSSRAAAQSAVRPRICPAAPSSRHAATIPVAQTTLAPTAADAEAERKAKTQQAEPERKAKAEGAEAESKAKAADAEAERKAKAAEADAEAKARAADREAERKVRAAEREADQKARAAEADAERRARAAEIEALAKAQAADAEAAEKARSQMIEEIEAQMQALQKELRDKRNQNGPQDAAHKRALEAQISDLRAKADALKRTKLRTGPSRVYAQHIAVLADADAVTSEMMRRRQELYLSLDRTISIELRDATVQYAAEAMSNAAGIPIKVDPAVPSDKRLTVVARVVSVKNILVEVANQTGLVIAPDPEGKAVILRPVSSLQVNQRRVGFGMADPPWSNTWGRLPMASKVSASLTAAPTLPWFTGAVDAKAIAEYARAGVLNIRQNAGLVSLTGLGSDRFVVASPAPPGENGVMLTVYRLEGSQLRVVSSTLHRFESGSAGARTSVAPPEPPKR